MITEITKKVTHKLQKFVLSDDLLFQNEKQLDSVQSDTENKLEATTTGFKHPTEDVLHTENSRSCK